MNALAIEKLNPLGFKKTGISGNAVLFVVIILGLLLSKAVFSMFGLVSG